MVNQFLKFIACTIAGLALIGIAAIGYVPGLLAALVDTWTANPQAVIVTTAYWFTTIWIFFGIATLAVGGIGGTRRAKSFPSWISSTKQAVS